MPNITAAGIQTGLGNIEGLLQTSVELLYWQDTRWKKDLVYKTLKHNYPESDVFFLDSDYEIDDPVNIIVSSPSCAQVSKLGMKRNDRKDLAFSPLSGFTFIQDIKRLFKVDADFFVVEYLKDIFRFLSFFPDVIESKATSEQVSLPVGYSLQVIDLNTRDFGLPQSRERVFFLFSKKKLNYTFVPPVPTPPVKVGQVLKQLDVLRESLVLDNDEAPKHSIERIEGFKKLKIGDSYYGGQNNLKINPNEFCPPIASHCTQYVHPWHPRVLTAREAATIQGFRKDFKFFGSHSEQLDFIGKTVSPVLIKAIVDDFIQERGYLL